MSREVAMRYFSAIGRRSRLMWVDQRATFN